MCIHCSLRKQKCRLKSTTTNGWRHFGQSEQRKSSVLFPIQSEKSPDSGFFTCDPTKKCIMPSSRKRHKGIIGRGHDLMLLTYLLTNPCSLTTIQDAKRMSIKIHFTGYCSVHLQIYVIYYFCCLFHMTVSFFSPPPTCAHSEGCQDFF